MLHIRWIGLWSTPESTTVTDSWVPVRSTCRKSYSPSSVSPSDSFCSFHIVRLFLTLCDDICTGTRCQIASDSNCVRLYTDVSSHYLSDLCTPATVHAHLRSSVTLEQSLSIPRTKTKTIGPRRFYFASSAAWNALPVHLRDPELSLNSFKIKLKTHFLSWCPPSWVTFIMFVRRVCQHNNS